MTKKERISCAIHHQESDRVPRGELAIEDGILNQLLEEKKYQQMSHMAKQIEVRRLLGMDFINIHEFPVTLEGYAEDGYPVYKSVLGDTFKKTTFSSHLITPPFEDIEEVSRYQIPDINKATTHQLDFFRKNSDLFLFCQVNGPASSVYWALGMEDYMCYCMTDTDKIIEMTEKIMKFETARAKLFLDHGADAIMMTDDIGFNTGTLLPPYIMDEVVYPYYRKFISDVKAYKDVPVFLHTDGFIYDEIPKIIISGFDGLQSLQPSAGMDIFKIKKDYGKDLCLMGNVDLDYLLPFGTVDEVKKTVSGLIEGMACGGGYILSTCNIMTDAVNVDNARAMYDV